MRIQFEKQEVKESKHLKFCKENGADYFEDECGVWIMPKKYGSYKIAVALKKKW